MKPGNYELNLSYEHATISREAPFLVMNIHKKTSFVVCDCSSSERGLRTKLITQIGPFAAGADTLMYPTDSIQWQALRYSLELESYESIFIFGGVDRRPLRNKARIRFGDNLTLAKARTKRVGDSIIVVNELLKDKIFTFPVGGNEYIRKEDSVLKNDRYVQVYGIY